LTSLVGIDRPGLASALLVGLGLLLQLLGVLLIGLDQLDFFVVALGLIATLILHRELFLSDPMGVGRLKRRTHISNRVHGVQGVQAKLHEV